MKTLLEVLREPLVIGAFVIASLFVGGVHFLSNWHYGKVELPPPPTQPAVAKWTENPAPVVTDIDLSDLPSTGANLDSVQAADKPVTAESDSYELTPEDEALLLEHFA